MHSNAAYLVRKHEEQHGAVGHAEQQALQRDTTAIIVA